MHIKFLDHGIGNAGDAVEYVLAQLDAKGEMRAYIEVILGDLHQFAEVADSLKFKYRYSSAVITFHPEDKPKPSEVTKLIEEFEKTAFPGLDPEQYSWGIVRHDDNCGSFHLHILIARVELRTGKSFNPAPPGWQKLFDPLRDYFNSKYGWKSPDIEAHPENARLLQPQHRAFSGYRKAIDSGVEDPRQVITDFVMNGIEVGLITNREEMLTHLTNAGLQLPRVGKNFITVMDPALDSNNVWRMKGALFDEKFDFSRAFEQPTTERVRSGAKPDADAADRFYSELTKRRAARAKYNKNYYRYRKGTDEHAAPVLISDAEINPKQMAMDLANASHGDDGSSFSSSTSSAIPEVAVARAQVRNLASAKLASENSSKPEQSFDKKLRRQTLRPDRLECKYLYEWLPDSQTTLKDEVYKLFLAKQLLGGSIEIKGIMFVDTGLGHIHFYGRGVLKVELEKITALEMSDHEASERVILGVQAKGWKSIFLTGSDNFFELAAIKAIQAGIEVQPQSPQQKIILEKIDERERTIRARATVAEAIEISGRNLDSIKRTNAITRELLGNAITVSERLRRSNEQAGERHRQISNGIERANYLVPSNYKGIDSKN